MTSVIEHEMKEYRCYMNFKILNSWNKYIRDVSYQFQDLCQLWKVISKENDNGNKARQWDKHFILITRIMKMMAIVKNVYYRRDKPTT